MSRKKKNGKRYGVAEWYGYRVETLEMGKLREFAEISTSKLSGFPCPFRQASSPDAKCNKKGGVCSLRLHSEGPDNTVVTEGPLVTLCPSRFWDGNEVFSWIGQTILGVSNPTLVKEVAFLSSLPSAESDDVADTESQKEGKDGSPVGRIDLVLVDPENDNEWCALEIQAVYFSGDSMGSHLKQYGSTNGVPVMPDKNRRPDFRSCGPKRLMPQLQTKVPTLRRWGKKMAVLVDKPFFDALGALTHVPHVSNCDIVWFVVEYDEETSAIKKMEPVFTTLESSVEALTAGVPLSREDFEGQLAGFIHGTSKQAKAKVLKLPPAVQFDD